MTGTISPPFRADHVGSLLRPAALASAREQAQQGQITAAQLREIEDRCIREAVAMQEAAGLMSITDGEFRRTMWHTDFLTGFSGIELTRTDYAVAFRGEGNQTAGTSSMMVVTGKVRRDRPVMVDHFNFLKSATRRTPKFCLPSPTYLHMRGSRKVISGQAYPDVDEFWLDIAKAYQAEIRDLGRAGCRYLQIDDVSFATMCDPAVREQIRADGEDPAKLVAKYCAVVNSLIEDRSEAMRVTMHTCRGNFQSMWMAAGGYEQVADVLFNQARVDGFFLEFDTERAGGFEPLRFMPKNKRVVLGLVSSKVPELESKELLKQRIEEASRFVPLENICISPQCGFASTHHGNRISQDIQRRKLERVVEVAGEVWGNR